MPDWRMPMCTEATRNGWLSLYDDGLHWVAAGETSLEQAMRVAQA